MDKYFNLPKYEHYDDPIIKSITINNAFHTSQAQASRDLISVLFMNIILIFAKNNINKIERW